LREGIADEDEDDFFVADGLGDTAQVNLSMLTDRLIIPISKKLKRMVLFPNFCKPKWI
jgi:hypothetical protein